MWLQVVKKLVIATPSSELVDAYLTEIARAYGVPWRAPGQEIDGDAEGGTKACFFLLDQVSTLMDLQVQGESEGKESTETCEGGAASSSSPAPPAVEEDPFEALSKRFDALKRR